MQKIARNRIFRRESDSSPTQKRLKIRHDPTAVLLYGNSRVG